MNKHLFARLISYAFHPILFAILVPFIVIYKESASLIYGLKWAFFSSFFLFIAAGLFFIIRPRNVIRDMDQDFDISHKENRHIFYSICALCGIVYFILAILFKGVFFSLSIISLGIILGIIVFDLLNYYIKVSVHVAIVTAYLVTFAALYGIIPLLGVVWILPFMIWSRLYLKKHTKKEVVAGFILGLGIPLLTVIISRQVSL
jgi:hypothetical protein